MVFFSIHQILFVNFCGYIGTRTQTNQRGHQSYGYPKFPPSISVPIFVVRTGFEPVLLAITLFTNHPYIGPSTIPPPDYVEDEKSSVL